MRVRVSTSKRHFARSLRHQPIDAEVKLWQLLRSRRLTDMKFRRQAPIGEWIVDFVSFEHRLIVEADGSQHGDSKHDVRRDQDLNKRSFRVLRFWNNDILLKSSAVVEAIFANMNLSPSPGALCAPPSPTGGEGKEEKRLNGR